MATITKRNRGPKPFVVRYWNPRQHEKSFATRAEAQRFARYADQSGGDEKFGDYAAKWLNQARISRAPATIKVYEQELRLHLLPRFSNSYLTEITRVDCKAYFLDPAMSRAKAHRLWMLFCAILNEAVRDKKITENPAKDIRIGYERHRAEIIPVTYAHLRTVEESIPGKWRLVLWLMYGLGLRLGEALASHADCVREDGTIYRVSEQVSMHRETADKSNILIPLKARKAGDFRDIPLPAWLLDKINAHIAECGTDGYLFPDFAEGRIIGNAWANYLDAGAKKAGIPGFHAHMCRHLYASNLITEGVPIDNVSRYLGHRDVRLTYSTYSHLMPSSAVRAREVSERAWSDFTSRGI